MTNLLYSSKAEHQRVAHVTDDTIELKGSSLKTEGSQVQLCQGSTQQESKAETLHLMGNECPAASYVSSDSQLETSQASFSGAPVFIEEDDLEEFILREATKDPRIFRLNLDQIKAAYKIGFKIRLCNTTSRN